MEKLRMDMEGETSAETAILKLRNLAEKFHSGEITEQEKETLEKLADDYISEHDTGDHGYYADSPSSETSYNEHAFYDLPNGLCLEGVAGNRQNSFTFYDVLSAKEREKRIKYLQSTAKE